MASTPAGIELRGTVRSPHGPLCCDGTSRRERREVIRFRNAKRNGRTIHMILQHRRTLFLSVTIGFAIAAIADAGIRQSPSVSGRVVDSAGYPVPGVFVTTTEESGASPTRVTTERDRTYQFAALTDGTY